ncbi:MAG: carboxypeptidase regulatory-like domain-containing protein [Planctomycetaceae bacterium]|nr:carboxypeptidase regulatory-like domain-containing protein [Planctomycetaceae bacterium]
MSKLQILCSCLLLLTGCGQSTDEMALTPVSGTITYQGTPIAEGVIRLVPQAGSSAPVRTTQINAGNYEFSERSAVKPGTYQVEISAYQGETGLPGDQPGGSSTSRKQYLPEQFNTKSTIAPLTIPPDSDSVQHDFNLK